MEENAKKNNWHIPIAGKKTFVAIFYIPPTIAVLNGVFPLARPQCIPIQNGVTIDKYVNSALYQISLIVLTVNENENICTAGLNVGLVVYGNEWKTAFTYCSFGASFSGRDSTVASRGMVVPAL